jgi:hypothetical protein
MGGVEQLQLINPQATPIGHETLALIQSAILSEFGYNLVAPRPFTEVASIYGPDMTGS